MINNIKPSLNIPKNSVFFTQLHSLRWVGKSTKECVDTLYNELIRHALQSNALIITDSHAIQNWWLLQLINNEKEYPGIRELIRQGVLLIVKRDGIPLTETIVNQIGNVPVIVDGIEQKMGQEFMDNAIILEKLTQEAAIRDPYHFSPTLNTQTLNLKDRILNDVLADQSVVKAYGLPFDISKILAEEVEKSVRSTGQFLARTLYFCADKNKILKNYVGEIKTLATSVHNCNFAITYLLPAVVSNSAFDHKGAMQLFAKYIPKQITLPQSDKKQLRINAFNKKLHINEIQNNLTINQLLDIRNSETFQKLQISNDMLFNSIRECNPSEAEFNLENSIVSRQAYLKLLLSKTKLITKETDLIQRRITNLSRVSKNPFDDFHVFWAENFVDGMASQVVVRSEENPDQRIAKTNLTSQKVLEESEKIINLIW